MNARTRPFDRTYEGLKPSPPSTLPQALPCPPFDRTYEGLKLALDPSRHVIPILPFDRTYEGLKQYELILVPSGPFCLLTVPMRV